MSASPVFSSAATSRPFIFSLPLSPNCPEKSAAKKPATRAGQILATASALPMLARVVPASRLDLRPSPEMVASGILQLDSLTGGLARGCLTEICGSASSGRTSILLRALAQATQRGEVCALIDASDAFHPASAVDAGVEMSRLLWVRCGEKHPSRKHLSAARLGRSAGDSYQGMPSGLPQHAEKGFGFTRWKSPLEQVLKVTDLLLQSNGFGMIALDLSDVPVESARRIPLASWFRFRRAVEHTPTTLLVIEQQPIAGSCSSLVLKVSAVHAKPTSPAAHSLPHSQLLDHFEISAQVLCSRLEKQAERKPMQMTTSFKSLAAWAG